MNYVTLYNVIDTRTEQFHSVVICKPRNARFYIPAVLEDEVVE